MSLSPFMQDFLLLIGGMIFGVALTAFSGVVKLYIDPIRTYRSLKGEIASALWQYGNVSCQSSNRDMVVSELRRLAGELLRASNMIYNYHMFSWLRVIPSWDATQRVVSNLTGLANSLGEPPGDVVTTLADNYRWEEVKTALDIKGW